MLEKPSKLKALLRGIVSAVSPRAADAITQYRSRRAGAQNAADDWEARISDVLACPDNRDLPRHPDAGSVNQGVQTMFNGVRVVVDGYYGAGVTRMLRKNLGSHEPQEELVFADVLRRLDPGSTMVELGAYWGFYSLWFAKEVPGARMWLVEPEAENLAVGQRNFAINEAEGHFHRAFVGSKSEAGETPQICVDDFLAANGIDHLQVLHADIQGAEVEMLRGAHSYLSTKRVDFIFISTHGEELHHECVATLLGFGYQVPVSVRPAQSYSFDGLIVAHAAQTLTPRLPLPSLKPDGDG